MTESARCPCASGDIFAACCGPLLDGAPAPTAERLMRSRYTAFVREDASYLLRTWHPDTRPETIGFETDLEWRRLVIVDRVAGGPFDTVGVVEFEALWRQGGTRGSLHERSRFVREDRTWFYVDGDIR
ncbi:MULTISPECIES: YchJ family protein [unclassified Microbacterium]|uniref:YchJ family protein n=1 Tax=unclassified Microbacterium TaxID=2609290 RepID=UPI0021A6E38D|nr:MULTISPECIES: YchJ family metal-binding protein [unclassified Microbacterium]MCT1363992.1 YchJ family metal-binding protein [Microbacterium sp. p3-SID131]MCT1378250.1 YchJ family metal-binding protein [Microbacterium sp. p3-SID337]